MVACPYGIPRYEWNREAPYVRKCSLCHHRVIKGKVPACVEACPEKAMTFGSRAEVMAEARRRLTAAPSRYLQRIWGEREVGGTSVLYISDIRLDFLPWMPNMSDRPLPELSWASLKKVPPIILMVGALMGGTYWVIGRRMRIAQMAGDRTPSGAEDRRGDA
jgi:formate dehydrogenase iron-sulfur subunit